MRTATKIRNAIMNHKTKLISIIILILMSFFWIDCAGNANQRKKDEVRKAPRRKTNIIDIYRIEAAYRVNDKWSMPKDSGCSKESITSLFFILLPSGEIDDIYYVDKSECQALNESAFTAIMEAAPFEPFPKGLNQNEVKVGLRFSPEGIQ
jgi:hypothetical protein